MTRSEVGVTRNTTWPSSVGDYWGCLKGCRHVTFLCIVDIAAIFWWVALMGVFSPPSGVLTSFGMSGGTK